MITKLGVNIVDDTAPKLGGHLDLNNQHLDNVTPAELACVHGVTSPLQTQLDAKTSQSELRLRTNLNPPDMARMVSVEGGDFVLVVKTTTGYAAVRTWDGTVTVMGFGNPVFSIWFYLTAPASGAWSKSAPKEVFVWSCTSGNAMQIGDLTTLACANASLTSLDVSGLTALSSLECQNNSLRSLDVSGLTGLTGLYCGSNSLESLDVSGLAALAELDCSSNALASLAVGGCTALTLLGCQTNSLAVLDLSGLAALGYLDCHGNSLTALRAVDVVLSYGYSSDITGNLLDAAALNQFYTDLGVDLGATGLIDVSGNPGTSGDDPTIATAKGYTIVGSD